MGIKLVGKPKEARSWVLRTLVAESFPYNGWWLVDRQALWRGTDRDGR